MVRRSLGIDTTAGQRCCRDERQRKRRGGDERRCQQIRVRQARDAALTGPGRKAEADHVKALKSHRHSCAVQEPPEPMTEPERDAAMRP